MKKNEKMGEPKYYESMYEFSVEQWSDDYIGTTKCWLEPETNLNINTCEGTGLVQSIGDDYIAEEILPWYFNDFGNIPDEIPEEIVIEHDGKTYEFLVTECDDDGVATPCYLCRYVSTGSFLRIGANDVFWLLYKRFYRATKVEEDDKYECIGIYATYEEAKKVTENTVR